MQINGKLFWVITFILQWNISILMGVVSSRGTMPASTGHEGSLNGLMSMKLMWIICCGFHSHLWEILDRCVRQRSPPQSSKHQMSIFWKNGVNSSSRIPETCRINAKAYWSCSGGTWWPNTLQRHFMLVFPLICHPSVSDSCQHMSFTHIAAAFGRSMLNNVFFLSLEWCTLSQQQLSMSDGNW